MKSKFAGFLEKLNIEDNLKSSIRDGYSLLFEELSSSGYGMGMAAYDWGDESEDSAMDIGPKGHHSHHGHGSKHTHQKKPNKTLIDKKFKFHLPSLVKQAKKI